MTTIKEIVRWYFAGSFLQMSKRRGFQAANGLFTSHPDMLDRVITGGRRAMTSLWTSLNQITSSSSMSLFAWFIVLFSLSGTSSPAMANNQIEEYCENQFFSADCGEESAIIITHALYGRMNRGKCIYEYDTGCAKDVRPYLEKVCAGRSSCKVAVSGLIKDVVMPCPIDLRSYLEAAFVCTRVVPDHDDKCHVDLSNSDQKVGYFSNHVIPKSGCGHMEKPWVLKNRSGQRFNITIIDFLIETSKMNGADYTTYQPNSHCNVYVIFKELGDGDQLRTICNSTNKENNALLSSAQMLEIRLIRTTASAEQSYSFIVKYEVLGCADPEVPEGGWIKRDDYQAIFGCHGYPHERLKVTCNGTTWSADASDFCSPGKRSFLSDILSQSSSEIFKGLSIIIITIVAAGVGLCILLAGLTYLKKRRNMTRQQVQQPQFYDKTSRFVQYGAYKETSYAPSPQYLLTYDTPQSHNVVMPNPGNQAQTSMVNQNVTPSTPQNFSENLYESPKFDRKFSDEVLNTGGVVCFTGSEMISKVKSQENVLIG